MRRPALYALCLLFALGCARSRTPSDSADTGTATAMSEAEYYPALAEAMCGLNDRCCRQAGLRGTSATCVEWLSPILQRWRPDPSSGARFDAAAAAQCVDGYADIECVPSKVLFPRPDACARVYSYGQRQPGEPCTNDSLFECAQAGGDFTSCARTSLREPLASACRIMQLVDEGERCTGALSKLPVDLQCRWPLLCDAERGVCVPRPARGEPCLTGAGWGDTCAQGSVCDSSDSKRCVEPAEIGSPCEWPNLCEGGACIEGRCREPLSDAVDCQP